MGGPAVEGNEARTLGHSAGLGDRLQRADVSDGGSAVEGAAEDAVHAVSVAVAALPEHDLYSFGYGGAAAVVVAGCGLCDSDSGDWDGVASRSGAVVGQCQRSPRDARQHGGPRGLRRDRRIYAGRGRAGGDRQRRAQCDRGWTGACCDPCLSMGCRVEDVYGGDVCGGSVGAAAVSLSGVAGGSEWARRGDGGAGGDGADAGSGGGGGMDFFDRGDVFDCLDSAGRITTSDFGPQTSAV